MFNLATEITPNKNLDFIWKIKWSDAMRDYGNVNVPTDGSASDVRLDDFLVNDLAINYKLNGYKVFLKVNNVFDEKYNRLCSTHK